VLVPVATSLGVHESRPSPPCSRGTGEAAGLAYRISVFGQCRPREALPLWIALHGMGDRPHEPFSELPVPVRIVMPQAPLPWGTGYSWFPYRSSSVPPAKMAVEIRKQATRVAAMVRELSERYPTRGKPIVTGVSQGGMLTFALALHHQDVVGEAFPVAGWLPQQLWPKRRAPLAVETHALHGERDTIVPLGPTQDMVSRLQLRGHPITLQTYPDAGHDVTPAMHARLYAELTRTLRGM